MTVQLPTSRSLAVAIGLASPSPNAAACSASKAGVIGLTKALAKEVAGTGVLVNCVTPAVIATPMLVRVSEEHLRYVDSKIPMGRVGQPDEVAALVSWLCSDDCSFSTELFSTFGAAAPRTKLARYY